MAAAPTRALRHRLRPLCGRCLRSCCPGAAAQPWLCHLASPGMRGFHHHRQPGAKPPMHQGE